MEISACFLEIISQVDLLIKSQKEQINNAIDIPDWEKAQEVMKTSYENIAKLKTLKSKTNQLKKDFDNSFLFGYDKKVPQKTETISGKVGYREETATADSIKSPPVQIGKTLHTDMGSANKDLDKDTTDRIDTVSVPKSEASTESFAEGKQSVSDGSENWLSLKEDFQNTKIKAILIENKKTYVKDFTEALVLVCEWLVKKDRAIFGKMLNASFVHGKRQRYISTRPFELSNLNDTGNSPRAFFKKLNNENIYVWTNTNSNAKASLIANMLKFFGLPEKTVMLSIREDYRPDEREYSERQRHPDEAPLPDWSSDIPDSLDYSTPVVHDKSQTKTDHVKTAKEKIIYNSDSLVDSKSVVDLCEELILKKPYKMALAFTSSKMGSYFSARKNHAMNHFASPHLLSNGLWVETSGITTQQLKYIKEYCGIK